MPSVRRSRKRGRKKNKENIEIDITSLLDILVIMLVFLLRSYNSSGLVMTIPKGITLPLSQSQNPSTSGVIIQVSRDQKIWVDNKLIIDPDNPSSVRFDQGGRRIVPLYDELISKRKSITTLRKTTEKATPFSGIINMVVDKSIKYDFLRKLMHTSAIAGFKTYKFVVLGEESTF